MIDTDKMSEAEMLATLRGHAELAKIEAEARKAEAEATYWAEHAQREHVEFLKAAEQREQTILGDDAARVYRFMSDVTPESVARTMDTLSRWHRYDRAARLAPSAFEVVLTTFGGYTLECFALYDFLRDMSKRGHAITTHALGYAYSAGAVLLQAGDHRVISPSATLLLHDGSGGARGTYGDVKDDMERWHMLIEHGHEILAGRSKLTVAEIAKRVDRRDWTINAKTAKRLGFVDEVA